MTEPRCARHPRERLQPVTREHTEHGVVLERENLYICIRCPEYLTDADLAPEQPQHELAI